MPLHLWCVACICIAIYNVGLNGELGGTVRKGRLGSLPQWIVADRK